MKRILKSFFVFHLFSFFILAANAGYDNERLRQEVATGLDIHVANVSDGGPAHGEMGQEVYQSANSQDRRDYSVYIPNTMYVRGGAGMNLGFLSSDAKQGDDSVGIKNGWLAQMGLGWNLSSYVRTEVDFQVAKFGFDDTDLIANSREIGGTLYFDFARRYVRSGDITIRRTFVPYMGLGAGVGMYDFDGANGADGAFIAPRGVLGLNIMLTDLIGIDIAYQYELMIGDGFGWNTSGTSVTGISNIMTSFRFNF